MLRPGRVPHLLRGREEGDAVPPRSPVRGDAGPVGGGTRRKGEERDSPAGGRRGPAAGGGGRWREGGWRISGGKGSSTGRSRRSSRSIPGNWRARRPAPT